MTLTLRTIEGLCEKKHDRPQNLIFMLPAPPTALGAQHLSQICLWKGEAAFLRDCMSSLARDDKRM